MWINRGYRSAGVIDPESLREQLVFAGRRGRGREIRRGPCDACIAGEHFKAIPKARNTCLGLTDFGPQSVDIPFDSVWRGRRRPRGHAAGISSFLKRAHAAICRIAACSGLGRPHVQPSVLPEETWGAIVIVTATPVEVLVALPVMFATPGSETPPPATMPTGRLCSIRCAIGT